MPVLTAAIKKVCFREEKNAIVINGKTMQELDVSFLHREEIPLYLRRKRKREEYLNGRYAIKSLLSRELKAEYADICILNERAGEQTGRPRLYINDVPADYSVSISHDAGIIFAGFSDHEIGVDVTAQRKIASDFGVFAEFTDNIAEESAFFCLIWAIREAFLKVLGIGFKYGLNSVKIGSIDLEGGSIKLEASEMIFPYIGKYSDIYFTYEMEEQAVFVMCHLIR